MVNSKKKKKGKIVWSYDHNKFNIHGFLDLAIGKQTLTAFYLGNITMTIPPKKFGEEGWLIAEILSVINTHLSSGQETDEWWDNQVGVEASDILELIWEKTLYFRGGRCYFFLPSYIILDGLLPDIIIGQKSRLSLETLEGKLRKRTGAWQG